MPVDPACCPLCGQQNHCARAADAEAVTCWCFTTHVPAGLRAKIPEAYREQACVCQACIDRYEGKSGGVSAAELFERVRRDH